MTCCGRYQDILQRLTSSPSVTIIHWEHCDAPHNWAVLNQPADGNNLQILVNKFKFQHMDPLALLQLLTGPRLRAVASHIALHEIALDPIALNSSLVTRVFYSLLPETSAEHAVDGAFPAIFKVLKRLEPSFASMSHHEEDNTEDVAVVVREEQDGTDRASSTERKGFPRFLRKIIQPLSYFHLLYFLATSSLPKPCTKLLFVRDLHRHWANLLSINLEHLALHNLASLQSTLANTEAVAQRCCEDGSSGTFSLSSLVTELIKFFRVEMSFRFTSPIISLVYAREIVSSLLYCIIFLIVLYLFLFQYFDSGMFSIFTHISEAIFYLGVAGCLILLFTKLFRMQIHRKMTMPLVCGQPIFSLLHDALLLRKSHRSLHPLRLSTEVGHVSDGNIVAALALQTPICSASRFLIKRNAAIPSGEQHVLKRLGSSIAAATRKSLQSGVFPSVCVGSGGEMTSAGSSLSKVMNNKLFIKMIEQGKLDNDQVAVDWWCGFNISGKRFAILHQLTLAPTITLVYVSDQNAPVDVLGKAVPLNPHLPLHDSGPIGMWVARLLPWRACVLCRVADHVAGIWKCVRMQDASARGCCC